MFRYSKFTFLREVIVWLFAAVVLSPLYLLINVALKSSDEFMSTTSFDLVKAPTVDSFTKVITSESGAALIDGLITSFVITAVSVSGLIFFGSTTAYVLVRRTNKLSNFAFYAILIGIVMPVQLGMVPIYIGAKTIGLLGSPLGMSVIYIASIMPLAVLLYGGFVRSLPSEYEEAATIDGASRSKTFFKIVFPLLAPATGTVAIMTGIIVWNDFFAPLIYMAGAEHQPIGMVIFAKVGGFGIYWNEVFAMLIYAMLPMTILYFIFQKKFIQGFAGGIKS